MKLLWFLVFAAVVLAVGAGCNALFYGSTKCAVQRCVTVVK